MEDFKWIDSENVEEAYLKIDIQKDVYFHLFVEKFKNMYAFHIDLHTSRHFGTESSEYHNFDIYECELLYSSLDEAKQQAINEFKNFMLRIERKVKVVDKSNSKTRVDKE